MEVALQKWIITQKVMNRDDELTSIVNRNLSRVYNICLGILAEREDAEDACQEVFMKLAQYPGRVKKVANLEDYLARMAINISIDKLRKRRIRRAVKSLEDMEELVETHEKEVIERIILQEDLEDIRAAIDKLPPRYRIPIFLSYQQGVGYHQICKILGIPRVTLRAYIFRGIRMIREILKRRNL
jgi:RNA polymerase sigma-70 factor (ECF subfamily)